jgi:hypothetical protein
VARKSNNLKHRPDPDTAWMGFVVEDGDVILIVECDGKRIAKRYSGENWISLEPGYTVRGSEPGADRSALEIEFNPNAAKVQ